MSGGTMTPVAIASARPAGPLAYAQLLRIPNVFTAIADIGLAALVTAALPGQLVPFLFLVMASCCLYCAGMVWNDYFDYDQDLKERPFRPLPSHSISRGAAARLGAGLLICGVVFAALAGIRSDGYDSGPLMVAILLMFTIMLYDCWMKRIFLGPLFMGLCRFLNVLLGLTVAAGGIRGWGFVLAGIVGLYILGVTWFARREASTSKHLELAAAALVMLTSLPLALFLPVLGRPLARSEDASSGLAYLLGEFGHVLFPYLLVAFGLSIGIAVVAAVRNPSPKLVQSAVKRAVLGLIVLDAVLATALAGTAGLLLLVLLPPSWLLGKWVYST